MIFDIKTVTAEEIIDAVNIGADKKADREYWLDNQCRLLKIYVRELVAERDRLAEARK